ncbi:MAG: DUF1015 domain-containing protein [Candidatus Kapaibacterium sp.]
MATFKPFKAYRPQPDEAKDVAAPPYDVINSEEAREYVEGKPLSFLHVGKPEVDLPEDIDHYDKAVYLKGKENLQKLIDDGHLVEDQKPCFYLYAQTMNHRTQYGLVGCASVDDYWDDTIKKHEKTRKVKEEDRANHVRFTNAHSGPIFLTYRDVDEVNQIVDKVKASTPANDHIAEDGIRHTSWVIDDPAVMQKIEKVLEGVDYFYVADGHHRSAAAAIVGRERQEANSDHKGDEEYNYFLAVLFPASQLQIFDYNRVVKDLHGMDKDQFIEKLKKHFSVEKVDTIYKPDKKGRIGMYIGGEWYKLQAESVLSNNPDPVESLDVAILQKYVLDEILGIQDPRTDERIDFVGGIRGLGELERRVNSGEMKLAFSMYPTSVGELMAIADAGEIMPPKSTWFEPKLRDGLFVHFLD